MSQIINDPKDPFFARTVSDLDDFLVHISQQDSVKTKNLCDQYFDLTRRERNFLSAAMFYEKLRQHAACPSTKSDFIREKTGSNAQRPGKEISEACNKLRDRLIETELLSTQDGTRLTNSTVRDDVCPILCCLLHNLHKTNVRQNLAGVIINEQTIKPFVRELEFLNKSVIPKLIGFYI